MTIKKQFIDLITFLEENSNKKVSSILEEVKLMASTKNKVSTIYRDEDDNVIAIFCYYHKRWELISEVEYGQKASSPTGLSNMCKVGTNHWYKAQRDAKQAKAELLSKALTGDYDPDQLKDLNEDIEEQRQSIDMSDAPNGFDTVEELKAYLEM